MSHWLMRTCVRASVCVCVCDFKWASYSAASGIRYNERIYFFCNFYGENFHLQLCWRTQARQG